MVFKTLLLETKMMLEQDVILVIFQFKVMISKILMSDYKLLVTYNVMLQAMLNHQEQLVFQLVDLVLVLVEDQVSQLAVVEVEASLHPLHTHQSEVENQDIHPHTNHLTKEVAQVVNAIDFNTHS
jgi:hypothetical protein